MNKFTKTSIIAGVVLSSVSLVACAKGVEFKGDNTANVAINPDDYNKFYKHTADVYKKDVTLGNYKDITIAPINRENEKVEDEVVEQRIKTLQETLTKTEDVTNASKTLEGDEIVLTYTGYVDGKPFEGGSATDTIYTVGSKQYIEDLDKGLIDKEANKDYDINVIFPADYHSKELAGKQATFKVKITKITRKKVQALDDTFVKENSKEFEKLGLGKEINTVAKLREAVKNNLLEQIKTQNDKIAYNEAIEKILSSKEFAVKNYPQAEFDSYLSNLKKNLKSKYEAYGSTSGYNTYDEYLEKEMGIKNEAELDTYAKEQVETYMKEKMAVTLIAAENNINVTGEEIEVFGTQFAGYYGYNSYHDLVEKYGKIINAEMGYSVLQNKVATYFANNLKQEATPQPTTQQ